MLMKHDKITPDEFYFVDNTFLNKFDLNMVTAKDNNKKIQTISR